MSLCHTLARHFRLYRAAAEGAQKYIDEIPDGLEFWACGSTVAAFAYDFEAAGVHGFNGAVAPQTASYDFRLLRRHCQKIKKGGTVIWNPLLFSLCATEYDSRRHLRYYYVLDWTEIYNGSPLGEAEALLLPPIRAAMSIARKVARPVARMLRGKPRAEEGALDKEARLKASAKGRLAGWEREFSLEPSSHVSALGDIPERMEYCLSMVRKMNALCEEKGLNFVVVVPPVSRALLDLLPADDIERFLLRPLKDAGDGFRLWNYWDDETFCDNKHFDEALCMNAEGRKLFTLEIVKRIRDEIL